jgi:hypothetical protein
LARNKKICYKKKICLKKKWMPKILNENIYINHPSYPKEVVNSTYFIKSSSPTEGLIFPRTVIKSSYNNNFFKGVGVWNLINL